MSTQASTAQPSYLVDTGTRKGLMAWLTTTDHKRIGLLYLYAMLTFFFVAVGIGFVMRLVQLTTFQHLITARTYNALFTVHGVIMIFLFVVPGIPAVFGNFFLPILIGAKDVAFPRLNLASWYFFVAGALLAVVGVVNVPIIYFSVRWWNTLHQGASVSLTAAPTMASIMLAGMLWLTIACWAYAFAVVFARTRALIIEREADTAWVQALAAASGNRPEGRT